MKNARLTILLCSLLSIAATVLFFLLTFESIFSVLIRGIAFFSLLLCEGIMTAKLLCIKQNTIAQATVLTSGIHLVVVLLCSVLFVNLFPLAIKAYLLVNVIFLCALAAVDILLLHTSEAVDGKESRGNKEKATLREASIKAQQLAWRYGDGTYREELLSLEDMIRYSDNSAVTGDEEAIFEKLCALEKALEQDSSSIPDKIKEAQCAVHFRSIQVRETKKGTY